MRGQMRLLLQLIQGGSIEMRVDDALHTASWADAGADGVTVVLDFWARLPRVFQALRRLPQARDVADPIICFIVRIAG